MLSGMVLVEIFTPSRSSSVKFTIFLNPQAFSRYASAAKSSRSTFPQVHPSKAQCPSSDVPVHTISDSYPFPLSAFTLYYASYVPTWENAPILYKRSFYPSYSIGCCAYISASAYFFNLYCSVCRGIFKAAAVFLIFPLC